MLVLQRKIGESIFIGDDIEVLIIDVSGEKAKVAIRAPRSIPILRAELKEAALENQQAANASMESVSALQNIIKK